MEKKTFFYKYRESLAYKIIVLMFFLIMVKNDYKKSYICRYRLFIYLKKKAYHLKNESIPINIFLIFLYFSLIFPVFFAIFLQFSLQNLIFPL